MKKLAGHIRDYIQARCSNDEVFQVETIGRLIDGNFTGSMRYGEVMKHGDFGLGTFVDLDGEMAAVDGRFWHFGPGGHGSPVDPDTMTPFAVVKFFRPDITFHLDGPCTMEELEAAVDARLPVKEQLCAVRARGRFRSAHFRVVLRQDHPSTLAEAAKTQSEQDMEALDGQLVGFRFPGDSAPVEVPGYHLHLIADEGRIGGHFHGGTMENLTVEIDLSDHLHLAAHDAMARLEAGASRKTREEIEAAERGRRS